MYSSPRSTLPGYDLHQREPGFCYDTDIGTSTVGNRGEGGGTGDSRVGSSGYHLNI